MNTPSKKASSLQKVTFNPSGPVPWYEHLIEILLLEKHAIIYNLLIIIASTLTLGILILTKKYIGPGLELLAFSCTVIIFILLALTIRKIIVYFQSGKNVAAIKAAADLPPLSLPKNPAETIQGISIIINEFTSQNAILYYLLVILTLIISLGLAFCSCKFLGADLAPYVFICAFCAISAFLLIIQKLVQKYFGASQVVKPTKKNEL